MLVSLSTPTSRGLKVFPNIYSPYSVLSFTEHPDQ